MDYNDLVSVSECDSKLYEIFHIIMERNIDKSLQKQIQKMQNIIYRYSFGNETVLGAEIIIRKIPDKPNNYKICFTQSSISESGFQNIGGYREISRVITNEKEYYGDDENDFLYKKTIKLVIKKEVEHPPPEVLFHLW
jgi:hypothetical protein